jgi:uncharacterized protein YfdQ (DUF2303 family)
MSDREDQSDGTAAEMIHHLTVALADPFDIGETQVMMVPKGFRVANLEALQHAPRARGDFTANNPVSFARLVDVLGQRIADPEEVGHPIVYVNDGEQPSFKAVLNPNTWRDLTVLYTCPLSPEWTIWKGADGNKFSQVEFMRFIEDNLPDITEPSGAEMLTVARSFEAKKAVQFASAQRLDNGEIQFSYQEEIQGTAAKGQLKVPEKFTITIPVFKGDASYEVQCRFRYRINNGDLSVWYDMDRPHKFIEDALKHLISGLKEKMPAADFVDGATAPAPKALAISTNS